MRYNTREPLRLHRNQVLTVSDIEEPNDLTLPEPDAAPLSDAINPAAAPDDLAEPPEAPLIVTDSDIAAKEPIPVPDDGLGEWPTNGGPLGCLVGLVAGFVITGFLASTLISFVHFSKAGVGGWFIFAAVVVMLVGAILSGWAGWRVGKRVYREYTPTPRQIRIAERVQRGQ